jgi:hypothetical protein
MKKILLCTQVNLIICCFCLNAQVKTYHVIDSISRQPLGKVSVLFTSNNQGSLTNEEGDVKVYMNGNTDTLNFSFIGYDKLKLYGLNQIRKDTIKLKPTIFMLEDVKVYSLDLKAKLIKTLKEYGKYYYLKPMNYHATYKESVYLNDSLTRLNQSQINWYNKYFRFLNKENFEKENQISLESVDFSKSASSTIIFDKSLHLSNDDFFKFQFPNFYQFLIKQAGDIVIDSIINYNEVQKVVFSAELIDNGKVYGKINNGVFYFENNTNALQKVSIQLDQFEVKKDSIDQKTNKKYRISTNKIFIELEFKKVNSKWGISFYKVNAIGEILYDDRIRKFNSSQELFVTQTSKGKQIPKENRILLTQPFYESTQTFKGLETKMILTKQELDFIEK